MSLVTQSLDEMLKIGKTLGYLRDLGYIDYLATPSLFSTQFVHELSYAQVDTMYDCTSDGLSAKCDSLSSSFDFFSIATSQGKAYLRDKKDLGYVEEVNHF